MTATEIANLALARIGDALITSIDMTTDKAARYCKTFYAHACRETLKAHTWNFALKRVALVAYGGTTPAGSDWPYHYTLPVTVLRILTLNDREIRVMANHYAREGDILFSDLDAVNLRYVHDFSATADAAYLTDPNFLEAFSLNLASKVARGITGDASLEEQMTQAYRRALVAGELIDANEARAEFEQKTNPTLGASRWVTPNC